MSLLGKRGYYESGYIYSFQMKMITQIEVKIKALYNMKKKDLIQEKKTLQIQF
jgi:hypothetical protein